jgi:hypothetical protein
MSKHQFIPEKNIKIFHESYTVVDTGYDTPCWLWNKALNERGYAQFWFKEYGKGKSKNHRGHRAAYIHFRGEIDADMTLDHRCNVEACVNPYHCEQETDAENNRLKWQRLYTGGTKIIINL